jgi:small basic protein
MIPIIGLLIGIIIGALIRLPLPAWAGRYLGIALLAALDSAFGGLRASLEKKFNDRLFIGGLITNTLMAAFIVYLGDNLGVELYLAAVVAFGVRIFRNLALVRRYIFQARHWE